MTDITTKPEAREQFGPLVETVDFAVPTHYSIGVRFPTFAEAVESARSTIQRFEYPGATPREDSIVEDGIVVGYSRAFVQMRQVEPIQDRPVPPDATVHTVQGAMTREQAEARGLSTGIASGSDGVLMSWEVFHDGTVRQGPVRNG